MFGNPMKKIEKYRSKLNGEKLASMSESKKKDVKLAAVDAMGDCVGSEEAYNALVVFVHDGDKDLRAHAIEALGRLGDLKARAHIEHQSKTEKDSGVKASIRKALEMLKGREDG